MMQMQGAAAQLNLNDLVFRPTFYSMAIVLLLVVPILTMRVFAEERKLKTFELLMTSPVGINHIVAGKFTAVLLIYAGMLALTGVVPVVLAMFNSFDWAPVFTGCFGLLLSVWLMGALGSLLGDTPAGNAISYLSFIEHYDRLVRGLVDTKDLVYYACGVLFMLFLTHRVVESQRWK
jgi:ABC-2 type transport system permease protein